MNVTVIGCGNAGLIHAAKMIEKGHQVGILKSSNSVNEEFYNVISREQGFNVKDETNGGNRFFARPVFITKDVEKAVSFADVIFVMTTTAQHEPVARKIAPYVKDGQVIVLVPGYMGSLIFKKYIAKKGVYSEWETTAYNGRIVDSMYVRITFYNPRNAISVLPVARKQEVLEKLSSLFDNTRYLREHILESALHNPNMIVHTIGTLLSASRIEHSKGEFWMYKEAFTPSVVHLIKEFDKQKNIINIDFDLTDQLDFKHHIVGDVLFLPVTPPLAPFLAQILIPSEIVLQVALGQQIFPRKLIERRKQIAHPKDRPKQRDKMFLILFSFHTRLGQWEVGFQFRYHVHISGVGLMRRIDIAVIIVVKLAHQNNAARIFIAEQRNGGVHPLLQVAEADDVAKGLDAVQNSVGAAECLNQPVHP